MAAEAFTDLPGLNALTAYQRCVIPHCTRPPTGRLEACPTLPSWRGEGDATRCEAAGPEKPEVYSLEYIEDFFGPSTTQKVADRSPQ